MMMQFRPVLTMHSHLGESPIWDADAKVLWWIDIYKPTLNRFDPKSGHNEEIKLNSEHPRNRRAPRRRDRGVIPEWIGFVNPADGTVETVVDPIGDLPAKFNDGKCDRRGRFWTGSRRLSSPCPLSRAGRTRRRSQPPGCRSQRWRCERSRPN